VALGRLVAVDLQRRVELDAAGARPQLPRARAQDDLPEQLGLTLGLSLIVEVDRRVAEEDLDQPLGHQDSLLARSSSASWS
jgi:hypothetical protein